MNIPQRELELEGSNLEYYLVLFCKVRRGNEFDYKCRDFSLLNFANFLFLDLAGSSPGLDDDLSESYSFGIAESSGEFVVVAARVRRRRLTHAI